MRLQSAMEYLMTYGWAILIIAVVLGALYSLGVFNSSSFAPQACIAQSGFYCQNPRLAASTGALTLSFGQASGSSWSAGNLIYVPSGSSIGSSSQVSNNIGAMASGGIATVTFSLTSTQCSGLGAAGAGGPVGTVCQGTLYANVLLSGSWATEEVATLSIKAS